MSKKLIEPLQKDDAFLQDLRRLPQSEDQWRMWWLGQSGFLIQWNQQHCLLDPYLSDSLTKKYHHTDKPHIRITERVINPDRLDCIHVATSSHHHTDHLDAETLIPIMQANPEMKLIIPEANRSFVMNRLQCDSSRLIGLTDGTEVEVEGFRFFGIPAAHEKLEINEQGQHRYMGYIISFGSWCFYHSGDTILYDGMVEHLQQWSIDVALLPINGRMAERRVAGNLNGNEAAQLAKEIGAKIVIPCHYDMFTFNTASPDAFVSECHQLHQKYYVMQNGEGITSDTIQLV